MAESNTQLTFLHNRLGKKRVLINRGGSEAAAQHPRAAYSAFAKMIGEQGLIVEPVLNIADGTRTFVSDGSARGGVVGSLRSDCPSLVQILRGKEV